MAFLIAIAATKKGAEQLVAAGVFETLATCNFVHAPVGVDVDANAAEFEIVERQHDTLVVVLQLLVRVLSSTQQTRAVADQVCFLT